MASPYVNQSIGSSLGADLLTRSPWYASGQTFYVHSSGDNSYAGTDRLRPVATIAQGYTNASAGDSIVILSGHVETLGSAQTLGKAGLHIYGEASGSSRARFTCSASIAMFDVTAAGVVIENLYFPASTAAPTARIRSAAEGTRVLKCYFQCGTSDTAASLKFVTGASAGTVEDCEFVSSSTSPASPPAIGIEVANAMTGLWMERVSFDGGDSGWSDYAFKGTAAITRGHALDIDLLNGSDFFVATGSVYRVHPRDVSGSSRVVLTA